MPLLKRYSSASFAPYFLSVHMVHGMLSMHIFVFDRPAHLLAILFSIPNPLLFFRLSVFCSLTSCWAHFLFPTPLHTCWPSFFLFRFRSYFSDFPYFVPELLVEPTFCVFPPFLLAGHLFFLFRSRSYFSNLPYFVSELLIEPTFVSDRLEHLLAIPFLFRTFPIINPH